MKAGYIIIDYVTNEDKCIEVLNAIESNAIVNLGYIYLKNIRKSKSSIGVWKIKK
jgi:hypothetical protein